MSSLEFRCKFCVSIFGKTVESLETRVRQARKYNPDLIELRLDFIRDLDPSKLGGIRKFLKGNEILTIRSRQEGGKSSTLSENERIELIRYAIAQVKPSFIDIELLTLRKCPILIPELKESKTKLVASFHDLNGTKDLVHLRKIVLSAPLKNRSLFAVKIVTRARNIQDNLKVLSLYSRPRQNYASKLVAFCIGPLGVPSRILSLFLGSPYGYASLPGEPVASGQLDIRTMKRIVGMLTQ